MISSPIRRLQRSGRGTRLAVLLALAWGSLSGGGMLGGRIAEILYRDRQQPPSPYSEQQIRSIDRASVSGAAIARRQQGLWRESAALGRGIARLQGELSGTLLVLGAWCLAGGLWGWRRYRQRRALRQFLASPGSHA